MLNVIEKELNIIIQKADRIEVSDKLNVYPVIVYQDPCFDIEGVRYFVSNRFEELKQTRVIPEVYLIKECVMIPLDLLIKLEDYFNDGRLQLDVLINNYIVECKQFESNKLLPFNKYIMRQAQEKGYMEKMSLRFKKISDLLLAKNRN